MNTGSLHGSDHSARQGPMLLQLMPQAVTVWGHLEICHSRYANASTGIGEECK